MKYRITAWLLVSFFVVAGPTRADVDKTTTNTEVRALLAKHDQALKNQDLAGVLETFIADAILMGTGPGEHWVGTEAIKTAYQHFFADYDPGSLDTNCTWRSTGSNESLAWLMAMCQFTDYLKNEKRLFAVNVSAVAEKQTGAWRFRTFHISNTTGGEQSEQPVQPQQPAP